MKNLISLLNQLFDEKKTVAIAVSGGADSMSLALLCQQAARGRKTGVTALIVDHGLRAESATEAKQVKKWLEKRKINAVILATGQPLAKGPGLQERARDYRYRLMIDWCKANKVKHLLLAHHADDQRETILMRLVRGSGVDGLAGMSPESEREGIILLRPLLGTPKRDLAAYLKARKQEWIEDPGNQNKTHTRNRLRDLNALLEDEGLSPERLQLIHSNLSRSSNYLNEQTRDFLQQNATFSEWGYVSIAWDKLNSVHEEIKLRVLKKIISYVSGDAVEVRFEEVLRLSESLTKKFNGATLGHTEFIPSPKNNLLYVIKERKYINSLFIDKGTEAVFDDRYQFTLSRKAPEVRYIIAPLGSYYTTLPKTIVKKHQSVPKKLLWVLPALFHLEELVAAPHIGWCAKGMEKAVKADYLPLKNMKSVAGNKNIFKI